MLEITLQRSGKRLLRQPIGSSALTIGRAKDNALRLMDPDISRYHCKLEWRNGNLYLIDLSTNGTLLNGDMCREQEVNVGDRISVGPWTLLLETTIDAVPVKTLASTPHTTRVLSYDPKKKRFATERIECSITSPDQAITKKRVAKGAVTIGHHASCDVAIADPYVSRRHCRLEVAGDRIRLIDLASTNGVFVGDTRITQVSMPSQGAFRVGRSVVHYRLVREQEDLRLSQETRLGALVGSSKAMQEVYALIQRVAPSDSTILITGESGTGKELAAREVHRLSQRQRGPFIAVNCGAIPPNLIESQLFGHERGAFTGAIERVPGLIEQAKGGTLFLDEIGEMPLELQTRLLRVLEHRFIRRVGGQEEIPIDFRLVCATNRDLAQLVQQQRFREDLYFRLFVVPVTLPSLRERPEDILILAKHFLGKLVPEDRHVTFTDEALVALTKHTWPGNARELKHTIERTFLLAEHDVIEASDVKIATTDLESTDNKCLKDRERSLIEQTIQVCKGNLSQAARKLDIARTTLQSKIKKYEIDVPKK